MLSEKALRQELMIPLLSKMGYIAPIEYHGTAERGKDIICFEYDRLEQQRFLAIVAKTGDLTGNASSNSGLITIVNQVQQAFDNPYEDLYNMRQVYINEVWIVTNGKIVSGAQESVIGTLRKTNLDKQIRIIGDDRLIELVDRHFSTFWNASDETKETVVIQRDRLLGFIESLLTANNIERSTIESVKSSILYSNYNPDISKNINGLHFSNVTPYSIELSVIDPDYDDYIVSNSYGITSKIIQEAKKHLSYSFWDIEETMEHANKISKLTNPWEFIVETQSNLARNYPFEKAYGDAAEFMDKISYLEEGLNDLKYFKAFLKKKGKLDWTKILAQSISELLPEFEKIINNSKEDDLIIHYRIDEKETKIKIEYNSSSNDIVFTTKYKRIEIKGFGRNKDGSLNPVKVMEAALHRFRKYVEELLEYDDDKWIDEYVEE